MRPFILLALLASAAHAQRPPPPPPATPPAAAQVKLPPLPLPPDRPTDYSPADHWLCRPGKLQDACRVNLDLIVADQAGERRLTRFEAAPAPPIDCFYVYPTVSEDRAIFSDLVPDQTERGVIAAQAARFSAACRVFAPMYRQFTIGALIRRATEGLPRSTRNYRDVRDAWRWYLAHENRGRGVVLIGHSQGAMMLKRLIAEEIDGRPEQRLLVSALLAGNPDLTVKPGEDRGGSFKAVPVCRSRDQLGCVVAWSSYADSEAGPRLFGGSAEKELEGVCVNPAAIAGGRAPVRTVLRKPPAAAAWEPPYVEAVGGLSAQCERDTQGAALRLRLEPGLLAGPMADYLRIAQGAPGWGLHSRDIQWVLGDLVDLVRHQGTQWVSQPRPFVPSEVEGRLRRD